MSSFFLTLIHKYPSCCRSDAVTEVIVRGLCCLRGDLLSRLPLPPPKVSSLERILLWQRSAFSDWFKTQRGVGLWRLFLKCCLPSFLAHLLLASWRDLNTCLTNRDLLPNKHKNSASLSPNLSYLFLFMRPDSCQQSSKVNCRAD